MAEVPELDRKINACLYRHDSLGAQAIVLLASLDAALCCVVFFLSSFSLTATGVCPLERIEQWVMCCGNFVFNLFLPCFEVLHGVQLNTFDIQTDMQTFSSVLSRCYVDSLGLFCNYRLSGIHQANTDRVKEHFYSNVNYWQQLLCQKHT